MITIEVFYDPIDNEGNERSNPEIWPWEDMADSFKEEEATYYTRTVKCVSALPPSSLPTDVQATISWHEENCNEGECYGALVMLDHCPMASEDDDDE